MTDAELIARLRGGRIAMLGHEAMLAADRLTQLSEGNERLRALAGTAIDKWESFVESDYAGTGMYDDMIADVKAARADLDQGRKEGE